MAEKLTKTEVDKLKPAEKLYIAFDPGLIGFGAAVYPSGQKSFVFQFRTPEGKQRRLTIGKYSEALTLEQARAIALDHAHRVRNGDDPLAEKQDRRQAWTVAKLVENYLASPTFAGKAESTQYVDRGRIKRHVLPLLGSKVADKVSADDIRRMQRDIAGGKTAGKVATGKLRGVSATRGGSGAADKAVLILRAAYQWAISEKHLAENPCVDVKVAPPGQRGIILEDSNGYRRMFETLDQLENTRQIQSAAADAIRFIALTGCRKGEAANMLWQYVDATNGRVVIPATRHKTGHKTGKPRVLQLPAAAMAIIARQPQGAPNDFVFRPAKGAGCIALSRPWMRLHQAAGLPAGLSLHGLRHSLASSLAVSGASNAELMTLLGHRQISTTLRYTHFAENARTTLAERAAAVAVAGMADAQDKPRAEVLPLKKA